MPHTYSHQPNGKYFVFDEATGVTRCKNLDNKRMASDFLLLNKLLVGGRHDVAANDVTEDHIAKAA